MEKKNIKRSGLPPLAFTGEKIDDPETISAVPSFRGAMNTSIPSVGTVPGVASIASLGWAASSVRMPENPAGFPNHDHVACLCVWTGECRGGEIRILQWNAYYKVWDGEDADDFFCQPEDVSHWMPLPAFPSA